MTVNAAATMAIACLVLLFGYGLRARIGLLDRLNLPAPVIGGLVASVTVLAIRLSGLPPIKFDTVLQTPLMIAFFTTIGFTASVRLLKRGGPRVVL
ncbi:MAG TPA: sodium/glutamate symporter, partial [Candidatus Ozemobacteraceae bacterium]|nr:sodium/glutamate symporter [Candidatus Ozemobacteraceae bacterium]